MGSVELNHVERRPSLGGEDAVLDVVVDQLDLDKVLQESGRLRLASFERSLERLKVGQDDLVGDVDGADRAYGECARVRATASFQRRVDCDSFT